jgi:hypothetical protein
VDIFDHFDLNFQQLERDGLSKEFEQISVRFEIDRIKNFLGEEQQNSSLFASGNGFYSKNRRTSDQYMMNKTFTGGFSNFKKNGFSRFSKENNKENRRNGQNLVHKFVGVKDYTNYKGMKYRNYMERNALNSPFSERKLLLEMQK